MTIDFLASQQHYRDHLWPIVEALGDDVGDIYVRTPERYNRPVVVASAVDMATATRTRRIVALLEHGAGQTYAGVTHRSYAGGQGRAKVSLFVCPSERVAALNRARNPKASVVVVGSPRVDALRRIERAPGPLTVAISFHWRCKVAPEAGTALDHYRQLGHLAALKDDLLYHGVDLIGHAHPRIAAELALIYAKAGIEWVPSFEDVVARADCLAVDNSSVLFEFAALDRPVVLLNCPRYRRDVEHGLRFWAEADVGVQVDGPGDLVDGILAAFAEPAEQVTRRNTTVARVYGVIDGKAAERAADALRSLP